MKIGELFMTRPPTKRETVGVSSVTARNLCLLAAVVAAFVAVHARGDIGDIIIQDTFTGTNGTILTSHAPDINLPADQWRLNGSGYTFFGAPTIAGNAASLSTDVGAMVYLTSYGSYTKPTNIQFSADLTIDGITDAGDSVSHRRGVGLGVWPYSNPGATFGNSDFRGLVLRPDGTLTYLDNLVGRQAVAWSGIGGAPFSIHTSYTLTYTIDTDTGRITSVRLSGSNADFGPILNDTNSVFLVANVGGAGVVVSSSGVGIGMVDNFSAGFIPPVRGTVMAIK
jgi:hypothetical protein